MNHKEFLKTLPDDVRAQLTARSDSPTLLRLTLHFSAIIMMAAYIGLSLPFWWALIPFQGVLIAFLFMVEHEATHNTLLKQNSVNDWVGRMAGFLIMLPFLWFRWFHLAHHRHTNDLENDPELSGVPRAQTRAAWAWHISGIPYWWAEMQVVWRLAMNRADDRFIPSKAGGRVVTEAQVMLVGYGLVVISLFFTPFLFWVWLLPVLFGQVALRVFLFSEHADCPHVVDMFENTRTTLTTRFMRLMTLNASYHIEHHAYPQVPWHNLPALHELMRSELKTTSEGYAVFTRAFLARHG
jgi:fatty acid desaturase